MARMIRNLKGSFPKISSLYLDRRTRSKMLVNDSFEDDGYSPVIDTYIDMPEWSKIWFNYCIHIFGGKNTTQSAHNSIVNTTKAKNIQIYRRPEPLQIIRIEFRSWVWYRFEVNVVIHFWSFEFCNCLPVLVQPVFINVISSKFLSINVVVFAPFSSRYFGHTRIQRSMLLLLLLY